MNEFRFAGQLGELDEAVSQLSMQVRKRIRAAMREAGQLDGLTQNEVEILLYLERKEINSAKEISKLYGLSPSLVSRSVESLVKKGYLETKQDSKDRRVVRLVTLPKSWKTVERLYRIHDEFMNALFQGITAQEGEVFRRMVKKMMGNLEALPPVNEMNGEREEQKE